MRRMVLALAVVLLFGVIAVGCGGEDALPEDAAAKVGEELITKDAFDARVAELEEQLGDQVPNKEDNPEEYEDFRAQVLDYMVTLEIVDQKQGELGVEVTEDDVQEQIDEIKNMFGGDEAQLEAALEEQGLTLEEFLDNLREQELINQSVEAMTEDVEVTDEEISAFYEENQDTFEMGESREARHILITPEGGNGEDPSSGPEDAGDEAWEEARQTLVKVREDILNGADFGEKAKEYSEDPGSAEQGGDLGNVSKGAMVPAFEEALFGLDEGEISQPVKTQYGYHLIQAQEINPPGIQELEDVREEIEAQLLDEKKREEWEAWLAEAKDDLDVQYMEGLEPTATTLEDDGSDDSDDSDTETDSDSEEGEPETTATTAAE